MNRKLVLIMALTLLVGMLSVAFNILPATASLPVHNIDTGLSYATIQEAINANETLDGHTILVDAGVYYENVVVNKTLSLVGENRDFTVIDANGTGNSIVMQADYSMVENFTIQNGGFGIAIMGNSAKRYVGNAVVGNIFRNDADAIGLSTCDKNVIANNTFENDGFNIIVGWINPFAWWDVTSNNNTITGNNMTQGIVGILILYSKHNVVSGNSVSNMTDKGIAFLSQPSYSYTPIVTNNSICNNVILNCTSGLTLSGQDEDGREDYGAGSCNSISGNVIQHNQLGLNIFDQGNNTIMSNVLANNVFGMYLASENNLLRANVMFENAYNLVETAYGIGSLYNDMDTSNTVNGRSTYYVFDQTDLSINPSTYPDMGFLALKNCSNVIIENMTFSNDGFGAVLEECTNITIARTTFQNNVVAISAESTGNLTILNNDIESNLHGISLVDCEYAEVENNMIANNTVRRLLQIVEPYILQAMPISVRGLVYKGIFPLTDFCGGIYVMNVENCTVTDNIILNNERGIYLRAAINGVFRNNTMKDSVYNFGIDTSILFPREWGDPNLWPNGPPPEISPYLLNDVDTSNTVDGKPVYWWINCHDEEVPNDAGYLVLVNCTNMVVKNLLLQSNCQGMLLAGVSNSSISNNVITNTQHGVYIASHGDVNPSTNNTITQNNITKNGIGIRADSPNSTISSNLLTQNLAGVYASDNVTITGNIVEDNKFPSIDEWLFGYVPPHYVPKLWFWDGGVGIILESTNSTVYENTIQDNYYGISVGYAYSGRGNIIYHNNFINNTKHIWQGFTGHPPFIMNNNTWDNGYPSGGNYWSNYTGVDADNDGIGDAPHTMDANNQDNYPLMGMFSDLNVTSGYRVQTICNSSISGFESDGTSISFNVTGEDGTSGFCRICIPTTLMNATYRVFVNGTEIQHTLLPCSNGTHSYLYFNYTHSTEEVIIIPEFPSFLILPLFFITTLLTVMIYRRKHSM